MEKYIILVAVALSAAAISYTVTTTEIFKWLRELVSPIHTKVEELFHCPWCFGFWTTVTILLCSPRVELIKVSELHIWNFLITVFAMWAVEGLVYYVLLRAFEPVAKAALGRKLEKMKKTASQ